MEAFRDELNSEEPEDHVAALLGAMRRELVAARAALPEFEEEIQRARKELDRERDALAQCERRGAMASRIGDSETARVAEEFAAKHRERIDVLEQKVVAAESELNLRRREADEMKRRYQEADANRFVLLSQLRQSTIKQRMHSRLSEDDEGPMGDFSRMEEKIQQQTVYNEILEEMSDLDGGPVPPRTGGTPEEVEERLRELKRRMGQK